MSQSHGGGNGAHAFQDGGAAESRLERQLMRQRGAGNRAINNVDFGFAFGTPSTVSRTPLQRRTRSKTPTTVARPTNRAIQEEAHPEGLIDPRLLSRSNVPSSAHSQRSVRLPDTTSVPYVRPTPTKRRRLTDFSDQVARENSPAPLPETIAEELDLEESIIALLRSDSAAHNQNLTNYRALSEDLPQDRPSSPLFFSTNNETPLPVNNQNKENETPAGSGSGSSNRKSTKRSKRKSIGQQSLFRKKRKSSSVQPLPTPSDTQDSIEPPLTPSVGAPHRSQGSNRRWSVASSNEEIPVLRPSITSTTEVPDRTALDESVRASSQRSETSSSNTAPRKRKKRKSVVLGPKRRRSSQTPRAPTPLHIVESIEVDHTTNDRTRDTAETSLNELSLDLPEATILDENDEEVGSSRIQLKGDFELLETNHAQQISRDLHEVDDDDDTYLPDEHSPGPTPAPKRKKKKSKARRRSSASETDAEAQRPSRPARPHSGFPIVMHRMTNAKALPTIAEEDESKAGSEDELALPPSFTIRKQPNAVDILAQACREQIDTTISSTQSSALSRGDRNKRLKALVAFRDDLEDRLFEVTQTLDHRLTMEARMRKAKRDKAALQTEWLEIRRQRDMLDLKKDAIRRKHWENEILSRKRFETSEAAFAVEELLDHEHDGKNNDLELRLRQAAQNMSSKDNGGVLRQMKDFNSRLERITMALG